MSTRTLERLMRCRCCHHTFTISRFTTPRPSHAQPPHVVGAALIAATLTAVMGVLYTLSTPSPLWLLVPLVLSAWSVSLGAWMTSYQDHHLVICPRCRMCAGVKWPWVS